MKRVVRRGVVGLAAAATAAATMLSGAPSAQAATPTVDVQQLTFTRGQSPTVMAQTFTAGATAQLVRVSLPFYTNFGMVKLGIQGVAADGTPDGVYKTSQFWSGFRSYSRQLYDFNLSQPIAQTQGVHYAIVVSVLAGSFNWLYSSVTPANFNGGKLLVSSCDSGCAWLSGGYFGADFGFETWVSAAAPNQPPTVAADNSSVVVSEGAAPTNTGTYSDPNGAAVTLTASSGTLTKAGSTDGTWSWSAPVMDEANQTVTLTATDSNGQTAITQFTVDVSGVDPVAKITTDPISVPEGTAETFTGAATSPDPADNAGGFSYAWNVTKNGGQYALGAGTSFTFMPDDEGTYVISLSATDDGGMTGTTSMTVVGTNVPPTASIAGVTGSTPLVTIPNELLTFAGSFSDPGKIDSHTATWNFGDGSTSTTSYGPGGSGAPSANHSYANPGTYKVNLTVSDDDGGVGQASTTVTVQTTQQALSSISAYVNALPLNGGEKQSLQAKLNAASDAAARGDNKASSNELNAFLNEVTADLNSGKLTSAQAKALRDAVHAIQGTLGTFNRFLEWWLLAF